jgi:hypothetical protein
LCNKQGSTPAHSEAESAETLSTAADTITAARGHALQKELKELEEKRGKKETGKKGSEERILMKIFCGKEGE